MRLKQLRTERGLLQADIGGYLGKGQNTISYYENGKREPSIEELKRIADYFNVSVDYLLGLTDNPKRNY